MNERKLIDKDEALQFRADNGSLHTLKVTNDGELYFEEAEGAPSTDAVAVWKASSYDGSSQLLKDLSGNGHHLKFGSSHPAYVSNGYLVLPGQAGNYASTPDSAAVSITGDIDIRVKAALDDWTHTTGGGQTLIAKWLSGGNQRSWRLYVAQTSGKLGFYWSTDGVAFPNVESTASLVVNDGAPLWVRVTRSAASGNITFYTSADGSSWSQLGTTVSAASGSLFDSNTGLIVGAHEAGGSNHLAGKVYWAEIRNGIDGPVVAKFDPSSQVDLVTGWTASTGETWTINSSAATDGSDPLYLNYDGTKYLYLPGLVGNYASVPHGSALDITGDIDVRVKIAPNDWNTSSGDRLISKQTTIVGSWSFQLTSSKRLTFYWWNASEVRTDYTSVAMPFTGSEVGWVRATLDVNNGASGSDLKFWTSTDGVVWSQLGSTFTTAGVTTIKSQPTMPIEIGSRFNGAVEPTNGKFYRVQVFASVDGSNKVLDVDFSQADPSSATLTATTGQTVTINRSSAGRKAVVVDRNLFLFGTDDYMEAVDNDQLDFAANDSFTVVGVFRAYGTSGAQALIAKAIGSIATGWSCVFNMSSGTLTARLHDGTVTDFDTQTGLTAGAVSITSMVRNVATDSITAYLNGGTSGSTTDPTTASLSNAEALRIGRFSGTGISYADMEFIGAAIWRRALTDEEISYLAGEFNL